MFSLLKTKEHKSSSTIKEKKRETTIARGTFQASYYYYSNIEFLFHNKYHRINGPAVIKICHNNTDNIVSEAWYYKGMLHRIDGPAYIKYSGPGKIAEKCWYLFGRVHRSTGPAIVTYRSHLQVLWEMWFNNGLEHNSAGPAVIGYSELGFVVWKEYYIGGLRAVPASLNNGPTEIHYFEGGQLKEEIWYDGGYVNLHRKDGGPSRIVYYKSGHKRSEEWHNNNELIQQVDYY